MEPQNREPLEIEQGTSVYFRRTLPKFPPNSGWTLAYSLRGNGNSIAFTSVSDPTYGHLVTVLPAVTEKWLPGEYEMEGVANNTDGNAKLIYLGSVTIKPHLATADPGLDTRTHAQRMLATIEGQLEVLAQSSFQETDVEGTRIQMARRTELLEMRQRYVQERRGEIAREKSKNGRPTGRKIKSVFAVTAPGPVAGQFGAGNSVFNTQFP